LDSYAWQWWKWDTLVEIGEVLQNSFAGVVGLADRVMVPTQSDLVMEPSKKIWKRLAKVVFVKVVSGEVMMAKVVVKRSWKKSLNGLVIAV
jgi:hypothetical protein